MQRECVREGDGRKQISRIPVLVDQFMDQTKAWQMICEKNISDINVLS